MWIHFDSEKTAKTKLETDGFQLLENGFWLSKDSTVKASIHPIPGRGAVSICYQEV